MFWSESVIYRIGPFFLVLTVLAAGCARLNEDYVIPDGHPASVTGRAGMSPQPSNALEPELQTVKPITSGAGKPRPRSGGHQHH
ncbi:MAG: hypothetical protein D6773_12715 [Alphaproteobacteria bacterium]|nr:MAG: hypothetical protein D6773_12715 [Alphaproteobacteria bacterium]